MIARLPNTAVSTVAELVGSGLTDPSGRVMRKLRVSLTDACQYRCFYCMPENPSFTRNADLLSPAEYRAICGELVERGIEELRVTGGEPTVRPEFREIMTALAEIPAKRLSLTSNGQLLERHLGFLQDLGCDHLNISLDSLDAGRFDRVTGGGDFRKVMACIERAATMGFHLKINAVVFRGVNDDELPEFARWSAATGIEVRFLEYMKIGPGHREHWESRFVPASEMIERLEASFSLRSVAVPVDSTSFVFETPEGARLGFIASESRPFCASCSRLRLSATGVLRSCLMSERGASLRSVPVSGYDDIIPSVLAMKPGGRIHHVDQAMHEIGG
ncbi:MAG TPA: GTP 3',8-cyclase MoaA [Fibrobacteria bacterium]|jgi:cyclic pyranopterin phosphate synthase|nr:GTP 3',8-cyclase MoaA [Fibrobacteria bacterium]